MKIKLKRAYDKVAKSDGFRVLADRLWPRGVIKASAKIDVWVKNVAPSNELRVWFHKNKEKRFNDFLKKYTQELLAGAELTALKKMLHGRKIVTIVTGVKKVEHSHIPTLMKKLRGQS